MTKSRTSNDSAEFREQEARQRLKQLKDDLQTLNLVFVGRRPDGVMLALGIALVGIAKNLARQSNDDPITQTVISVKLLQECMHTAITWDIPVMQDIAAPEKDEQ